ncbi:MAG: glutathione S-transferase family protein [Pseudomonadales bacterium]|nr:glutathione S-transferase family protein [Pseudomonadales bacterium]
MITLHGIPLSNYYSIIKMALLEKGMAFEEALVRPNQEQPYLDKSPMGKVPCLETGQGFLTETDVILDYLDESGTGPHLFPQDPFARAKVRELMKYCELYLELPARRLYGEVFFNQPPLSDEQKKEIRQQLEKGFAALDRLAAYDPYLAGKQLSAADLYFLYTVGLVTRAVKKGLDWDVFSQAPKIRDLLTLLGQRESAQKIAADQAA